MKTSAIIPVKTFSKAKSRLQLTCDKKEKLCKLMLEEVLHTLSISPKIDKIILVSKDNDILALSKKFNAIQIFDEKENGVNHAVELADKYLLEHGYEVSLVLPQDIPFIKTQDIDFLFNFEAPPKYAVIVPSRKFDGTNALVRMPVDLMQTHYDEDSYKIHLNTAKALTQNTSLAMVRRIMLDIDDTDDLAVALKQNEKPQFCQKISKIIE